MVESLSVASVVEYVEYTSSASDLSLHTIQICAVLFSSSCHVYGCNKSAINVTAGNVFMDTFSQ